MKMYIEPTPWGFLHLQTDLDSRTGNPDPITYPYNPKPLILNPKTLNPEILITSTPEKVPYSSVLKLTLPRPLEPGRMQEVDPS